MSTTSDAQKEAINASRRAKYAAKREAKKEAEAEAAALKTAKKATAKWNTRHPDDQRTVDYYLNKKAPWVSPIVLLAFVSCSFGGLCSMGDSIPILLCGDPIPILIRTPQHRSFSRVTPIRSSLESSSPASSQRSCRRRTVSSTSAPPPSCIRFRFFSVVIRFRF